MMSLEELALLAQIIGTVIIVISLVFVGIQVREAGRQARATAAQLAMQSEMNVVSTWAEHAGTWEKVVTGAPLAPGEETRRGVILFNLFMLDSAHRFRQVKAGYLEAGLWEGRRNIIRPTTDWPIYQLWRKSPGALNLPPDFLELLDELASERRR